tara:strand:+ start:603 stop:1040 length:438 start_codon:yes stop_codon:yes gene_type:complete
MAYKQPSTGPFKMMGSSPVKQDKGSFNLTGDSKSTTPGYSTTKGANKGLPKNFNTQGGKTTTPGYNTTKAANKGLPKGFNTTGTSKAGNIWQKGKELVKKGAKGASRGNILALMLGSTTTATADQPTEGKGKREYEGGKIDFTKK